MLDFYVDLAEKTDGQPEAYQSRWNCDGTFWVWEYEKNRSPEQFQKLLSRIRDGHITVPINPLVEAYGGAPLEAILRGMYYAGTLERKYNLSFPLFTPIENQALPYGLGALYAGCGAKYAWKGICGCASRIEDAWDREHDIYWWVGPDGSRILMKWNSMLAGNTNMGGYAEARDPAAAIELVETNLDFQRRYPYKIIGIFGKGWDDLKTLTNEFVSIVREKTNNQRQVIVSNEVDFFRDFEAVYGNQLPQISCSFGNEWEIYNASLAEVSAQVKRTVEKLRGAEALASLVQLFTPEANVGEEEKRELAFMNFARFYDHDWTADSPVISRDDRAAWQRGLVETMTDYVENLFSTSAGRLGDMISTVNGTSFYVFNSLSWMRTDIAYFLYKDSSSYHIIDRVTGDEVPSQWVEREGGQYIQILAMNIPPL
ncbi:MAG: glycoside hydrolase, partial [Anaerolineaceae bacterium]|nr:glycoside hydrolase [Anaerolineaceae bacterium]